jgi:LysR family transcriptional regulator, glycine cleavage system transcriptional activator
MHKPMPPLSALRAFEAAARHLSLTKAAAELHVTAGALSHQIRGLEQALGLDLFERRVRAIALTPAGKLLYPGLQTGFTHIREAVAGLRNAGDDRVLVISTPPGFTSKWLAPRLYRFASAHPQIDARISSSLANADFTTDGVDIAVRHLPIDPPSDPALLMEKLVELSFVPVCSPRLIETHGPFDNAEALAHAPLIHDDTLANRASVPTWADWFAAAGVDAVDVSHGLRFNSSDHALDATGEGAGVLLATDLLAYDDLRTGRLVIPVALALPSGRAYHLVRAKSQRETPQVQAFRQWIRQEIAALDWTQIRAAAKGDRRTRRRKRAPR